MNQLKCRLMFGQLIKPYTSQGINNRDRLRFSVKVNVVWVIK